MLSPIELQDIQGYLDGYLNGRPLVGFDRMRVYELIQAVLDELEMEERCKSTD